MRTPTKSTTSGNVTRAARLKNASHPHDVNTGNFKRIVTIRYSLRSTRTVLKPISSSRAPVPTRPSTAPPRRYRQRRFHPPHSVGIVLVGIRSLQVQGVLRYLALQKEHRRHHLPDWTLEQRRSRQVGARSYTASKRRRGFACYNYNQSTDRPASPQRRTLRVAAVQQVYA